jgi:tripartite-type tricarboxylate transporter receptor subunit TctC
VPKGTPAPVVKTLFAATTRTMEHPDVVNRIADGGGRVVLSKSPADFLQFWQAENERFARVVKDAGIETE